MFDLDGRIIATVLSIFNLIIVEIISGHNVSYIQWKGINLKSI